MDTKGKGPVRIQDVAAAAGVSVATVSNVLNKPHLVQDQTRELVGLTMSQMGYEPNAHAVALRRDAQRRVASDPILVETTLPAVSTSEEPVRRANEPDLQWEGLHIGDRVEVLRAGRPECAAVVDAIMPDTSALWIWRLDGMGRQLLLREDAQYLRVQL